MKQLLLTTRLFLLAVVALLRLPTATRAMDGYLVAADSAAVLLRPGRYQRR